MGNVMSKLKYCICCCGLLRCNYFNKKEKVKNIYDQITSDVWDTHV